MYRLSVGVSKFCHPLSFVAVLCCMVSSLLMPGVATAASASPYCANSGSGLCGSDEGLSANGSAIRVQKRHPGASQNVTIEHTTICGHGFVTAKCPFKTKHNNAAFLGQPIDTIKIAAINKCWAGPAYLVVVEPCNNIGTSWVGVNIQKSAYTWVNVYYTNHTHNTISWLWTDNKSHGAIVVVPAKSTQWSH